MPRKPVDFIENTDCVSGMRALPEAHVDLIITDPPFAIDFGAKRPNYNRTPGRVLEGYNEISAADYPDFTRSWTREAWRVLKDSGAAFVFSGWNNLKDILIALDEVGFVTVNHLIWKYQFGVATKRRFVTSHYHCLYVCKDDKQRTFNLDCRFGSDERTAGNGSARYRDLEDVWDIKREYWTGDVKTPTKLPREVVAKIIDYASDEGDIVMDPFLGSGQVAVVAKLMGRRYIGYEVAPEYYDFVQARLDSGQYRIGHEEKQGKKKLARRTSRRSMRLFDSAASG